VAEAEQVEQIMGMISGIIKELERQVCRHTTSAHHLGTPPRHTPHAT
jgi:hypothetical protein